MLCTADAERRFRASCTSDGFPISQVLKAADRRLMQRAISAVLMYQGVADSLAHRLARCRDMNRTHASRTSQAPHCGEIDA